MKNSRFNETQIINILNEQEKGFSVKEICRKHGISPATFHNWKNKYGGMTKNEIHKLRALEQENARLKKLLADQALDVDILKDLLEKKF